MNPNVKSLLYDRPRLYDLVFPDADDALGTMCRTAFERYLPAPPRSVLDVGCGTGRLLEPLSTTIAECWGVDYMGSNVAYARTARPDLLIRQGDFAEKDLKSAGRAYQQDANPGRCDRHGTKVSPVMPVMPTDP